MTTHDQSILHTLRANMLVALALVCFWGGDAMSSEVLGDFDVAEVSSISVRTISGDVKIRAGDEGLIVVQVENELKDPADLVPEVFVADGKLTVREAFKRPDTRGRVTWEIVLPAKSHLVHLGFKSSSGDLTIAGGQLDSINAEAASGALQVEPVEAKSITLSSSSGSIDLAVKSRFVGGTLSSASGAIVVELDKLPVDFLKISTMKRISLAMPTLDSGFYMTARKWADEGAVVCPIEYSHHEVIEPEASDDRGTDVFTWDRGKDKPTIDLSTARDTIIISEHKH